MRKGKRLLSILLCLAMVCSFLPGAMAENGAEGQLLFKYSDTGLREMSQFPTEIDTNHALYFYFGTAERSVEVAAITSSKTDVVTISAETDGGYKVYIAGVGTTTLTYTVDGVDRTVDVTIPEGSEDTGNGDGSTTLAMTAYQYNGETATGVSFPGGLEACCPDTFFLQFKAGETTVTSFENSNTTAVNVSESGTDGVVKVELLAAGTAVLSASVGLTPYMFVITVSNSPESGGAIETGELTAYAGYFKTDDSGTQWVRMDNGASSGAVIYGSAETMQIEFIAGTKSVTEGLSSSKKEVAEITAHNMPGVWTVTIKGMGTTEFSVTIGDVTYKYAFSVVSEPQCETLTAYLGTFIVAQNNAWTRETDALNGECSINLNSGRTDYFIEVLAGEAPVTTGLSSSDPEVATVTPEGSQTGVWVLELKAAGTVTLYVVIDDVKHEFTVNIVGDSGGQEGDGTTETAEMTAYGGTLIMADDSWAPDGTSYSGSATVMYSKGRTHFFQFKAGDVLVTSELTSSDESVATIGKTPITETSGVWGVNMQAGGSVTLRAKVNDIVYEFKIIIDDGSSTEIAVLMGYVGQFVTAENVTQWVPGTNGSDRGTVLYGTTQTMMIEFKAGGTKVTEGLSSSNPEVATLESHPVGAWEVTVKGVGITEFSVTIDGVTYKYTFCVVYNSGGEEDGEDASDYSSTAKITVGNTTYDAAVVDVDSSGIFTFLQSSGTFAGYLGCFPETTYVIGAVKGLHTGQYAEAPANVYNRITDVSVEVVSYTKFGVTGDQSAPEFVIGEKAYNGIQLRSIQVNVAEGDYFKANVLVKITVLDENDQEVTYTLPYIFQYIQDVWIDLYADKTTAADLNQILGSDEAFYEWVASEYPNYYRLIQTSYESPVDQRILVRLYLPAVTYEEIIMVNISEEKASIFLYGSGGENGDYTTLPGLHISGQIYGTERIRFVADERYQQTYGGETFTCGILYYGTNGLDGFGNAWSTSNCTFSGFDYAVRTTKYGFGMGMVQCVISDCQYGLYIDDSDHGSNSYVKNSLFIRNETAIKINRMPGNLSSYDLRATNCDFIGNTLDFDVNIPGTFYFHSNYFAKVHNKSKDVSTSELIQTLAQATTETKLNQVVTSNAPRVNKAHGVKIITNPKWKYLIKGWAMYGVAPLTLEEEEPYVNILISDWVSETQIVDTEAGNLKIDASAFDMETEEKKVIDVVDQNENAIGTWIFD